MSTLVQIIKDHKTYGKQIFKLAKSDIQRTYRGAALGWAWAIIKPVITIAVYWFAFTVGIRGNNKSGYEGYTFFLWMLPGVIPWMFMSEMLTQGTEAIRSHRYLVTKLKFPVAAIPTFVTISKFIINLGLFLITILIFTFSGHPVDIYYLELPLYLILMFIFFAELTLLTSVLSAISKDFANLVKSFVTPLFWLSGIMWDPNKLIHTHPTLRKVLLANPITYLVTGFRNVFVYKRWIWQDKRTSLVFFAVLIITGMLAIHFYKKTYKDLPDVL